jgi:AcrR family transcriptional regulator
VSESVASSPRGRRGRPRTPGAEERLFQAALEEYGEHGWAGFTMDAVARRAGVGKSTIYLRWRDKDHLLSDAVEARRPDDEGVDTGSLRGDLELLATSLFRFDLDPAGWATLRIAIDAAGSPEPLGRFTELVTDVHIGAMNLIAGRAVERGEAPRDLDFSHLWNCLYGSITMQTLTIRSQHREVSDEEIVRRARDLASFVLAGAGLAPAFGSADDPRRPPSDHSAQVPHRG